MEGFAPPIRVLRSICRSLNDCEILSEHFVIDKRPRLLEVELSKTEQIIVLVFRKHGPILSIHDAIKLCVDQGAGEASAQ